MGEAEGRRAMRIPDITSNTNRVHVLFHTDESVSRSGWRLEWSSSPSSSVERELATSGVLTSLNFPERYLDNLDIVQKIQVAPDLDSLTKTTMIGGLRRWSATRTRWKFCSTLMEVAVTRVGGSTGAWSELKRACQRVEFWYRRTTRHVIQAIMTRPRSSKLQRANTSVLSSQTSTLNQNMTGFRLWTHLGPIFRSLKMVGRYRAAVYLRTLLVSGASPTSSTSSSTLTAPSRGLAGEWRGLRLKSEHRG